MTDKVEVKIVGDESSAQAALRRSAAAVTEASNVMRDRLGAIRDRSREAFAGMAQDAQKAEGDVQQATTSIGSAFDRLKARFDSFTTGFKQGWREADAEIKAARQSAENASASGGKLERGFGGALEVAKGFVIAKIAEHIAEIGSKTIETATEFERLRSVLTTLQGSEAGGAAQFAQLKKFSTDTPYELSEVVESFAKLKSQGLDPSNAALTSYGNTAAAMGKSLDQMIEAVADAAMGEYERLKEFGIKAVDAGDKVIFNFNGQATEVKKNSADIQAYLQKIGNTDFAGAMDRQMDTCGVLRLFKRTIRLNDSLLHSLETIPITLRHDDAGIPLLGQPLVFLGQLVEGGEGVGQQIWPRGRREATTIICPPRPACFAYRPDGSSAMGVLMSADAASGIVERPPHRFNVDLAHDCCSSVGVPLDRGAS
ncbi:tape measure protein [Novosphingobium sp. EMRT-2]|uniref:tape measure protein n=1 Tax=Novosphingobium sp. EMRT-2 TaxID=2571749 RepID=UPI0010BDACB9|nr:tape measure protein [Novosphingobium sp. EMRT-2]QCI93382.1 hypothetical protein FA702_07320 [Novosphingobium sp. EMRT-2]